MSTVLLAKPASAITEVDLQAIVSQAVPESLTLDYKRELNLEGKAERKEFAADVCAFANKAGGFILAGISETNGAPQSLDGLDVSNLDALKLQIDNVLGALISPKVMGIEISGVPLTSGKLVLALKIPASLAAPHAADGRFFGRTSAGKYQMDITEVGAAFRTSAGFLDKARAFHRHRRDLIEKGDWAVSLEDRPRYVVHIIPRRAFDIETQIDVAHAGAKWSEWLLEWRTSGMNYRYNFDGLAVYGVGRDRDAGEGGLLFRNGIFEGLVFGAAWQSDDGNVFVDPVGFEDLVIEKIPVMLEKLAQEGAGPPYVILISALGVLDARLVLGMRTSEHAVDRDVLECPPIQVLNVSDDLTYAAKPILDAIWQAGGLRSSLSYDEGGSWIRKREGQT